MVQQFMNKRPHEVAGRPLEVMRGYPKGSEVPQKDQQGSRVSVSPVHKSDRCRLTEYQIRGYFGQKKFGEIFEVTLKNNEGDFFVDYNE